MVYVPINITMQQPSMIPNNFNGRIPQEQPITKGFQSLDKTDFHVCETLCSVLCMRGVKIHKGWEFTRLCKVVCKMAYWCCLMQIILNWHISLMNTSVINVCFSWNSFHSMGNSKYDVRLLNLCSVTAEIQSKSIFNKTFYGAIRDQFAWSNKSQTEQ